MSFPERASAMEFHEKLQELRKRKGLTQEELAERLFVSRTAVSKWESGRGYPNIDSLKAAAKFFSVTVDELLSGDELLTVAEEDGRQKEQHLRSFVFGLLDLSAVMFFFLPLFGQVSGGIVSEVSLLHLTEIAPWLRSAYFAVVAVMAAVGLAELIPHILRTAEPKISGNKISLILNAVGTLLFIMSRQPYAAALLFIFLAIKALMLIKKR